MTWGANSLTQIKAVANALEGGNGQGASLWGLVNPTPGTANIVVTWPENQSVACQMGACYLTGAEQALPSTLTASAAMSDDTANGGHDHDQQRS